MAEHYRVAVMPARPYKPKDKAKVGVVQIVERWILARTPSDLFAFARATEPVIRALLE